MPDKQTQCSTSTETPKVPISNKNESQTKVSFYITRSTTVNGK